MAWLACLSGCCGGGTSRMPHLHFEICRNTRAATSWTNKLKTSQLAFPTATCQTVYATGGCSASVPKLAAISFAADNVFSDGVTTQMATMSGSNRAGWTATLQVGISV